MCAWLAFVKECQVASQASCSQNKADGSFWMLYTIERSDVDEQYV